MDECELVKVVVLRQKRTDYREWNCFSGFFWLVVVDGTLLKVVF